MEQNLVYETLISSAQRWPNSIAVYDEYGTVTFSELLNEVDFLASILKSSGIKQGMCVGVMSKNSRHFISNIFAVISTGACVMPMSNQLKNAEIDEILRETNMYAVIDDQQGVIPVAKTGLEIPLKTASYRLCLVSLAKSFVFAPHVNNPAFVRFTSGTTGKAKGVIISHKSAIDRIESANKALELGNSDIVIWVLPMAYHFVVSILLYIRFGAAIALVNEFLGKQILDKTNEMKGTFLYASPLQIKLLAHCKGEKQMPTLRKVISTTASISSEICSDFRNRFQLNVAQAYGIIEIGLPMINHKSADLPESVGMALPDYEVDILDDDYRPLHNGEQGRLGIKGPGMFDAYLSPALLCTDVLKNGYFITSDYAIKTKEGDIIIKGREKSVINIAGNKVFPEEVENVLETMHDIVKTRVSAVEHLLLGQILQAEIILESNSDVDPEEILRYCHQRLSPFKVPQKVVFVKTLETTGSGKIIR